MSHSCQHWIARFRADYFHRGSSETTWNTDYQKILNRLPSDEPLTVELLHGVVVSTEPHTRTRKRACFVCAAIAKFAGLDYDPSPYAGRYSPKSIHPRQLPTDAAIEEQFNRLQNRGWRWFFGMMATYGLRPHEVFRLELDQLRQGDRVIQVRQIGITEAEFIR